MARRGNPTSTDDTRRSSPGSGHDDDPVVIHDYPGTGVTPVMIGLSVVAILLVIFLAQNTEAVPVEFLVWDGEAPLFVVVLVTVAATALLTLGVAGVWRRRRRRSRSEREELERLRRDRS